MVRRRDFGYRKHWRTLVQAYGADCFYCHDEPATCIDHVIPYSYDFDNSIENLVPACGLCNALAADKHFEDVEQKRQYILNRRQYRKNRKCLCVNCRLPFAYREHSRSLFLCARCYDQEFGTSETKRVAWIAWLSLLREVGIEPDAYFAASVAVSKRGKNWKQLYAEFIVGYMTQAEDANLDT